MRRSVILVGCLVLLVGCPAPKPAGSMRSKPVEPHPLATEARPDLPQANFLGAWTMNDDQGQPFDIILFPNGQAVSTWAESATGAQGERGLWRTGPDGVTVFFHDGWTDRIILQGGEFLHEGFSPDRLSGAAPSNTSAASRVGGDRAGFVGIWRLNKEPDGNYLYATLQSSGRAFSTLNGEGTWKMTAVGALCTWSDGWNDLIFRTPEGFKKRAWVGADSNTTPPDLSEAVRVGESRFAVSP